MKWCTVLLPFHVAYAENEQNYVVPVKGHPRYTALYLPYSIEYKLKLTSQKHRDSIQFNRKSIWFVTFTPGSPDSEAK